MTRDRAWIKRQWRRSRLWLLGLITLVGCLLPLISSFPGQPWVEAAAVNCSESAQELTAPSSELLAQGGLCYERGQFEAARSRWEAAAKGFAQTGDRTGEFQSRLNWAQALKALGNYRRALEILDSLNRDVPAQPPFLQLKAQALRSLGDTSQSIGELDTARKQLTQSLEIAQKLDSADDISAAYFSLGMSDRAQISHTPPQELQINSSSELSEKLASALTLHQRIQSALCNFQQAGGFTIENSSQPCPLPLSSPPTSTAIAQAKLNQFSLLVDTLPQLNSALSNALELAVHQLELLPSFTLKEIFSPELLRDPQRAAQLLPKTPDSALPYGQFLDLKSLRDQTVRLTELLLQWQPDISPQLERLPQSRAAVNARLHYAQTVTQLQAVLTSAETVNRTLKTTVLVTLQEKVHENQSPVVSPTKLKPLKKGQKPPAEPSLYLENRTQADLRAAVRASLKTAATTLAQAIADAQALQNPRTEASARASLVEIYGRLATDSDQWATVETLAQESLKLAQTSNSPDIAYRLQWQLSLALKNQGKIKESRAACQVTAQTLQSLRSDLVAIDQETQFTFRDSVKPFYRECVEALLPAKDEQLSSSELQANLESARQLIESLQLAELDNFFREVCLQGRKVNLDEFVDRQNPQTAVIYPIVISQPQVTVHGKSAPQQLAVIVKIPHQPLQYQMFPVDFAIEPFLIDLGQQIQTSSASDQSGSQQVYEWLVAPFKQDLVAQQVDTLVFVPDEAFRNVPMAALATGQPNHYLVDDYAIAISPGLQLLASKPTPPRPIKVLAGGLSELSQEAVSRLSKNPQDKPQQLQLVGQELESISKLFPTQQLLGNRFTSTELKQTLTTAPYNIVHLSTHGKFSSLKNKTYILAYDRPIFVDQLSQIFQTRDRGTEGAIELLVLSACETAKSDDRATLGLAGIALKTGVRSAVAPLWTANEAATNKFMDSFYAALKQNKTKAQAVQEAQIAVRKSYKELKYWAPFVLVGDWAAIEQPS